MYSVILYTTQNSICVDKQDKPHRDWQLEITEKEYPPVTQTAHMHCMIQYWRLKDEQTFVPQLSRDPHIYRDHNMIRPFVSTMGWSCQGLVANAGQAIGSHCILLFVGRTALF